MEACQEMPKKELEEPQMRRTARVWGNRNTDTRIHNVHNWALPPYVILKVLGGLSFHNPAALLKV